MVVGHHGNRFFEKAFFGSGGKDDFRTAVVKHIGNLLGGGEHIHRHDYTAVAHRAVEGEHPLRRVLRENGHPFGGIRGSKFLREAGRNLQKFFISIIDVAVFQRDFVPVL